MKYLEWFAFVATVQQDWAAGGLHRNFLGDRLVEESFGTQIEKSDVARAYPPAPYRITLRQS